MAKIRLKYAIEEFGGTLYEVDLKPSHQEEGILPKRDQQQHKPSGSPSEAQKTQRQHFKEATAYAKVVLADPQMRAQYEEMAKQQGKRPRGAAIADYLKGIDLISKK